MISPVNQVYPTALYHAPGDHGLSATGKLKTRQQQLTHAAS